MFDRIRTFRWHILWQPLCAMLYVWLVLYTLHLVETSSLLWAVGASSLASSAYIVFVGPQTPVARPMSIVGSYVVAMAVGALMSLISWWFQMMMTTPGSAGVNYIFWVCAAVAVGLSMLLMVIFDFAHPPAVGVALVLVLELHNLQALGVILIAAVVLALLRLSLYPYLRNLL